MRHATSRRQRWFRSSRVRNAFFAGLLSLMLVAPGGSSIAQGEDAVEPDREVAAQSLRTVAVQDGSDGRGSGG